MLRSAERRGFYRRSAGELMRRQPHYQTTNFFLRLAGQYQHAVKTIERRL